MPWVAINRWDPDPQLLIIVSPPEQWNRVKQEVITANPAYEILLISPLDPPTMLAGIKGYRYETRYCPYPELKKMMESGLQRKLQLITYGRAFNEKGEIIYAEDTDDEVS